MAGFFCINYSYHGGLNDKTLPINLQSLHAMEGHVMINFLPTILNQLVHVLTSTSNEDVAVNTTR